MKRLRPLLIPLLGLLAATQSPELSRALAKNQQGSSGGSNAEQLLPGTKRCPDGSILRIVDNCVAMPDHRFEWTHEPKRQSRTRRWWCTGNRNASHFTITLRLVQPTQRSGTPTQVKLLDELVIEGRPASPALKKSVQQQLDSFHRFDDAGGRCLSVRSGGTIPVLTLHGVVMLDGQLKKKHDEIRLR